MHAPSGINVIVFIYMYVCMHSNGYADGRPVEEMKIAIDQLLQEYLLSSDLEEATRCIKELNAPLFAHEVVKLK